MFWPSPLIVLNQVLLWGFINLVCGASAAILLTRTASEVVTCQNILMFLLSSSSFLNYEISLLVVKINTRCSC